jgi:hypothetical protein
MRYAVRLIRTRDQLQKVVVVRALGYRKHIPTLAETLERPEDADFKNATLTIGCEDLNSKMLVGSVRITLNQFEPLPLEAVFNLEPPLSNKLIAEASRLVVPSNSQSRLVKLLLIKAVYLYCHALQVKWLMLCARSPLDKEYEKLGMVDVAENGQFRPVPYIDHVPHRALGLNVMEAERIWSAAQHPLYNFMAQQVHPEIKIFDSVKPMWEQPRLDAPVSDVVQEPVQNESVVVAPSLLRRH